MSEHEREHLTPLEIAALVEGGLSPERRRPLLKHVATCTDCSAWLAETHAALKVGDSLPPLLFYHPLEQALSPLRRFIPWPIWVWHLVFQSLIPVLWVLAVDVRTIPHMRSPFWVFAPWPVSLLMTSYLMWSQGWFRRFGVRLWRSGVPAGVVDALMKRHLAPLQGRGYGGGKLFLGLGILVTLTNAYLMPPSSWRDGVIVGIIGLYGAVVTMAMYWSWGWAGWWWYGVVKVLGSYREQAEPLWSQARAQALVWLLIASVSMVWHLAVYVHLEGVYPALRVYGVIVTFLLLSLWYGYALLEQVLLGQHRAASGKWQALVRITIALLITLVPIGVI